MSYNEFALKQCPTIQGRLEDAWNANLRPMSDTPVENFITSQPNRLQMEVVKATSKVVEFQAVHSQRYLESDVTEVEGLQCAQGESPDEVDNIYELDPREKLFIGRTIKAHNLTTWCGDNPQLFERTLLDMVNAMDRAVASKHAKLIAPMFGKYASDVTGVTNDVLTIATEDASDNPNPKAIERVQFALQQTGYTEPRMIAAGADFWQYYRLMLAGCCADTGLDLERIWAQYGQVVAYDRRLAAEMATNGDADSLVIQLNSIQPLNYYESEWKNGVTQASIPDAANYMLMGLMSPNYGYIYDLIIKNECPGEITMNLHANTTVVDLPDNLFRENDRFNGVKWINAIEVDNS